MSKDKSHYDSLTEQIIGCAYTVGRELGSGFLEKVYENALQHELNKNGLNVENQKPITVYYDGVAVGEYFADLVINNEIIVELKAVKEMNKAHYAQCIHYLKATQSRLGLLINFGSSSVQIKRIVNGF